MKGVVDPKVELSIGFVIFNVGGVSSALPISPEKTLTV